MNFTKYRTTFYLLSSLYPFRCKLLFQHSPKHTRRQSYERIQTCILSLFNHKFNVYAFKNFSMRKPNSNSRDILYTIRRHEHYIIQSDSKNITLI